MICTLLVACLCFPALQSADFFLPPYRGQDAKNDFPTDPTSSAHTCRQTFIQDVIHDYFTDLKLTSAEAASKDPKGFVES